MAKPKVFMSSTFYDLRHIRNDLERFVKEMGYEPILNERGDIPYGKNEGLEFDCYKEIKNSDILVSILGKRYGSESHSNSTSITQEELKKAWSEGKHIYVFIEKDVYNEHRIWELNKNVEGFKCSYAESPKIHEFISSVMKLPINNNIHPFESSNDIIKYLRNQWAGLFQRFLEEDKRKKEVNLHETLQTQIATLKDLTTYLMNEKANSNEDLKKLVTMNNSLSKEMKKYFNLKYEIILGSYRDLENFLLEYGYIRKGETDIEGELAFNFEKENVGAIKILKEHFENGIFKEISGSLGVAYITYQNDFDDDDEFPF